MSKDTGELIKKKNTINLCCQPIFSYWELFSARHEHFISVPDSTSLNHCSTDKTLQHLFKYQV